MIGAQKTGLSEVAAIEAKRSLRTGRGFTLVRIAPFGWAALEADLEVLERIAECELRKTDCVQRTPNRELGLVLVDTTTAAAGVPIARVRAAAALHLPGLRLGIGWCCVGPGESRGWQEAWRWAGTMLVADSTVPAAA